MSAPRCVLVGKADRLGATDFLDDPWEWYGNTFIYQLNDDFLYEARQSDKSTLLESVTPLVSSDVKGVCCLGDFLSVFGGDASLSKSALTFGTTPSPSLSLHRFDTQLSFQLSSRVPTQCSLNCFLLSSRLQSWNSKNEAHDAPVARSCSTPIRVERGLSFSNSPVWPFATQDSLFGNILKEQKTRSTERSNSASSDILLDDSDAENPPGAQLALENVFCSTQPSHKREKEGDQVNANVSITLFTQPSELRPGQHMPELPAPNGACLWGDVHNERMACYIDVPTEQDEGYLSKSLALWILEYQSSGVKRHSELDWIRSVEPTEHPDTLQLDLEDHVQTLTLQFNDQDAQRAFKQQADCTATAVSLVEQKELFDQNDVTYRVSDSSYAISVLNTEGALLDTVELKEPEKATAVCAALNRLQKKPLQRLPSMIWNWFESVEEMMHYARTVSPEALYLAHKTELTVFRRGVSMNETSNHLRMRLLVSPQGGVALQTVQPPPQQVPANLLTLRSFDPTFTLIDLSAIVRAVPNDSVSFLVTLRHDEHRRLILTQFQSLIHRWAVGDLLDSISYYSCVSNFSTSVTVHQQRVSQLLQAYLRKAANSPNGRDMIHLRVNTSSPTSTPPCQSVSTSSHWVPVRVQGHCLVWADDSTGSVTPSTSSPTSVLDPAQTCIEWVKRDNAKTVRVKVKQQDAPLVFQIARPKVQCLFGEYLKISMARQKLVHLLRRGFGTEERRDGKEGVALITHLVEMCREQCLLLARLNIRVQNYTEGDNSTAAIPAHFNLICTRIVPDRGTATRFSSIDLKRLVGVQYESDNTARIKLGQQHPPGHDRQQVLPAEHYLLHFPSLLHLFAFHRFCHHILSYYDRKNTFPPPRSIQGRVVLKPGARIARTKVLRRGQSMKSVVHF